MLTPASRLKAERVAGTVYWCAGVFFVFVYLAPVLVVMIIGLVTGTTPTEAQGGVVGVAAGYPAFDPQSSLLWIPAAAMLFLAQWTIPLPLRSTIGLSRLILATTTFTLFLTGLAVGSAFYGAPGISNSGVIAVLVIGLAFVLIVVRAIDGLLRLVPRS